MADDTFCRTNSSFTDQSRAEGNNTECVGKKRFKCYQRASERACVTLPLFDKVLQHFFSSYGYL